MLTGYLLHTFLFLLLLNNPILRSALSPELPICISISLLDKRSLTRKLIPACPKSPFLPQCSSSSYTSYPSKECPHLPNYTSRHLGVILEYSFYLHFPYSTLSFKSGWFNLLTISQNYPLFSIPISTDLSSPLCMTRWDVYQLQYSSYLKFPCTHQVTAYLNVFVLAFSFSWTVFPL